jgi:hypothetical protein
MAQKPENRKPAVEAPGAPVKVAAPAQANVPGQPVGTVPTGLIPLDDATADRLEQIAEAAYKRAQDRNFAPGHDLEDWLAAEKDVDAQRKGHAKP